MLDYPTPEPTSAGVLDIDKLLLVAPYNNLSTAQEIIEKHKNDIAAVIVEPLQRCIPPEKGFLEGLRKICTTNNLLLIFDEWLRL